MSDFPFDIPTVQPSSSSAAPAPAFAAHSTTNINANPNTNLVYNTTTIGSDDFNGEYYTVPQDGLYQFNFSNYGARHSSSNSADVQMLVRRDRPIGGPFDYSIGYFYETNNPATGYVSGGFSMTARLLKDDKVFMKSLLGWAVFSFATGKSPCIFSGFYISP